MNKMMTDRFARFTRNRLRRILAGLLLAVLPAMAAVADKLTVNFRDADIRAVIESVAEITGRSFIVDPRVQGKITIIAPQSLDSTLLYEVILSALQVHGFQAVDDGAVTRIVPFTQSFQLAGGVGNEISTVVLKTNYLKASELLPTLKPMVSKGALVQAHDASNHLVITDTRSQIARIRDVLSEMDSPSQSQVEIISLSHISAGEALHIAGQLSQFQNQNLSIVEDLYNNRLIVSGSPVARRDLKAMVQALDVPTSAGSSIEVLRLNFAQAEAMKTLLDSLMTSSMFKTAVGANGETTENSFKIEADLANNALVVAASPSAIAEITKVIRKLDVPRKQVLIEAIVAEISEDQAKRLTVQLAAAGKEGGAIVNFNELMPALIGLGLKEDITTDDFDNVNLGNGITGGGFTWDENNRRAFGLLIEALKGDANTNILSTPSIVTMDNEEASISVGQEVPFITGRYESSSNAVNNPFQTIEREEVGVKLKVRPQINDGEVVRLTIEQETSNLLASAASAGTADVITAKRLITTNVMVGNGEFLVLGGLIDESFSGEDSKVPILGDIPILGHLFRSRSRDSNQSVLMVFIHPTILDNQTTRQDVTSGRYEYLRQRQTQFRENYEGESLMPPLPENLEEIHKSNDQQGAVP
jgi:general secretion pathway protein D